MTDLASRRLERLASSGDEDAIGRLARIRQRSGGGRHADKIGEWCAYVGVRDHYRGRLLSVTEFGGGVAILRVSPCYWLSALEDTDGEIMICATEDHPMDLLSTALIGVVLQPEEWPAK